MFYLIAPSGGNAARTRCAPSLNSQWRGAAVLPPPHRLSPQAEDGKYIISDRPLTVEECATVIGGEASDVTPALPRGNDKTEK